MADEPQEQQQPDVPETPEPDSQDVDSLPTWAREQLTKANKEAAKYRTRLREVEPLAVKAKELEESQKSEQQKLAEQLEAAKADGAKATAEMTRLDVALDKAPEKMEPAQIRRLAKRLSGSTREELEVDAVEMFADFDGPAPSRRPQERLRPGAASADEPASHDMNAQIRRQLGRT